MHYEFDKFYDKDDLSFGSEPSPELKELVSTLDPGGQVLDLGAGDGRNSLYLARNGLNVTAIDNSLVGLKKLIRFAGQNGLPGSVTTICSDVRYLRYAVSKFDLVVAVTIFDHLSPEDISPLFEQISDSLAPGGFIFVRVHTIADPGYRHDHRHSSELAKMIRHYFAPDELKSLMKDEFVLKSYAEKVTVDDTHGPRHFHGFASAIGQKIK